AAIRPAEFPRPAPRLPAAAESAAAEPLESPEWRPAAAAAPACFGRDPESRRPARALGARAGLERPGAGGFDREAQPDPRPGLPRPAFPDDPEQRAPSAREAGQELVMKRPLLFLLLLLAPALARAQSVHWDPPGGTLAVGQVSPLQLQFQNCDPKGTPAIPDVPGLELQFSSQSSNI